MYIVWGQNQTCLNEWSEVAENAQLYTATLMTVIMVYSSVILTCYTPIFCKISSILKIHNSKGNFEAWFGIKIWSILHKKITFHGICWRCIWFFNEISHGQFWPQTGHFLVPKWRRTPLAFYSHKIWFYLSISKSNISFYTEFLREFCQGSKVMIFEIHESLKVAVYSSELVSQIALCQISK